MRKRSMEKVQSIATGDARQQWTAGVQLIVPAEHFVVKARTRDGTKVFVNVCSSSKVSIGFLVLSREIELHCQVQAAFSSTKTNPATKRPGVAWDIPFIMGKLGDSKDKQGSAWLFSSQSGTFVL